MVNHRLLIAVIFLTLAPVFAGVRNDGPGETVPLTAKEAVEQLKIYEEGQKKKVRQQFLEYRDKIAKLTYKTGVEGKNAWSCSYSHFFTKEEQAELTDYFQEYGWRISFSLILGTTVANSYGTRVVLSPKPSEVEAD